MLFCNVIEPSHMDTLGNITYTQIKHYFKNEAFSEWLPSSCFGLAEMLMCVRDLMTKKPMSGGLSVTRCNCGDPWPLQWDSQWQCRNHDSSRWASALSRVRSLFHISLGFRCCFLLTATILVLHRAYFNMFPYGMFLNRPCCFTLNHIYVIFVEHIHAPLKLRLFIRSTCSHAKGPMTVENKINLYFLHMF